MLFGPVDRNSSVPIGDDIDRHMRAQAIAVTNSPSLSCMRIIQ